MMHFELLIVQVVVWLELHQQVLKEAEQLPAAQQALAVKLWAEAQYLALHLAARTEGKPQEGLVKSQAAQLRLLWRQYQPERKVLVLAQEFAGELPA